MNRRLCICLSGLLFLLAAAPARAQWQTVNFDLTKKDAQAYTTDIPDQAFTPDGLKLPLKGGATYTLTSKQIYGGDFSYDLQQSLEQRGQTGTITIEMVLVNDSAKRKAVGTYTDVLPGSERCDVQYIKDGKAAGFMWNKGWCDRSSSAGHDVNGVMEWLRMHKAQQKIWFMQKFSKDACKWAAMSTYPVTTYFHEDCDAFQVGLVIRCSADATGTLLIKTLRIAGTNVAPPDPSRREFHFEFGPVNKELEDDFDPVSEYTTYTPEKRMGWIIPEPEKMVRRENLPDGLSDEQIAKEGFQPINQEWPLWAQNDIRQSYWMELNDKKFFYSESMGRDYIDFFQKWLDLKTPLERNYVGMAKPYHFSMNDLYEKDVEERRGSAYVDDDLSAEFVVDLPNGQYNLILGVGYVPSGFASEASAFNVEVQGRVRKQNVGPNWRRVNQFPIRGVDVANGQMRIRFFCDVRKAMDRYFNHLIGTGWMINYMLILPADKKELMNEWEWKIIKRRGDIIRRVSFVQGDPAVTHNEGRAPATQAAPSQVADAGQIGFLTLNGKPWYFLILQNNYHPGTTEHYPYYCLNNCLHFSDNLETSKQFFKPDWEKLSYSDDYPWRLVDQLNTGYSWGCLTALAHNDILSFVPQSVLGEGNPTVDSRGRRNRYNLQPPLNSALGREIQKEAFTMMSNQIGTHPGVAAHYIYEELWHPEEQGYDDQSLLQYWQWLQTKYGTIEALNKDWGSSYQQWEDITQPVQGKQEFWQYTPQYVNFRDFRSWAQQQTVRSACELVRKNEPDHFTWGAKGDFGTQSWYTGEFLDGFGWYTAEVAASVARYFGRTAICGGYHLNNEYAYIDGRRQFDYKPGPRRYLGRDEGNVYNQVISSCFKGTKGFYNEWYSDAMCDAFQRTELVRRDGPKYKVKHWTGQIAFFEPPAYEGPPVRMARNALYADRANQMLYRLGQLWLPAAPLEPRILIPTVQESFFLPFFGAKPYADFDTEAIRILRSSNLPVDFMAMSAVKDLSRYQLIIIGDTAQAISRTDARRIKDYVAKGGKLIIMNGGGFSDNARPRRYLADKEQVYPLEEFADLGGYTLEASNAWHIPYEHTSVRFAKNDIAPEIADGKPLGEYTISCYYVPRPDSQVFLKGTLAKENREVALGILNKESNVAVIDFPPKDSGEEVVRLLSLWFRKLITSWKIDGRMTLGGVDDAWDWYGGCLVGQDYTLATVCNYSPDKTRNLTLQLNFLPAGDYAVMDVTGEHPDLLTKPDGGISLKSEPVARQMRIEHQFSAEQLALRGIPAQVPPMQAQVFLIRPLAPKVWVSIWRPWLKYFGQKPVTIAYGTAAGDKAGAEDIRAALAKVGVKVNVVAASDVKRMKLHHEVRINPFKRDAMPKENTSVWNLVDKFDNQVVDSSDNFIVVGSTQTNDVMKLWTTEGSFIYDKVLEKVTSDYPGPGRGVIGAVDSINSAIYSTQSQSGDGIIVGGSDDAGTKAAVGEFVSLIGRYCTPPPAPATGPANEPVGKPAAGKHP